MKSHFCRRFLMSCTKRVRFFIALLSGLCLLFSGPAASAEESAALASDVADILSVLNTRLDQSLSTISSDVSANGTTLNGIKQQVQYLRSDLASDLSTINGNVTDVEDYLRQINNKLPLSLPDYSSVLSTISGNVAGLRTSNHADLSSLSSGLFSFQTQAHSDLTRNWLVLSNILVRLQQTSGGGGSADVLAGNPWWSTNSSFALTYSKYSSAYPSETPDLNGLYSFPQFLSKWSGFLTMPVTSRALSQSTLRSNWASYFGVAAPRFNNSSATVDLPYTWFDWMSDATRSNWVLQASALAALHGVSNAVVSSSSSSGSFEDVLAGNPWWATNSAFARNWASYAYVYPQSEFGLSFPEAFSAFLSARTSTSISRSSLWDDFGIGGINQGRLYTFDDWLAEAIKSNLVLSTASSVSNLAADLYQAGYDTDDVEVTNSPLPEYSLPDDSLSEASDALQQGESTVSDFIDNLPKPGTGGNSELVVIPEFTIGGIHVSEYRASLSSSIVPVCRQVLSFLYAVSLFCGIFVLAKGEYAFWISWGRWWGKS